LIFVVCLGEAVFSFQILKTSATVGITNAQILKESIQPINILDCSALLSANLSRLLHFMGMHMYQHFLKSFSFYFKPQQKAVLHWHYSQRGTTFCYFIVEIEQTKTNTVLFV